MSGCEPNTKHFLVLLVHVHLLKHLVNNLFGRGESTRGKPDRQTISFLHRVDPKSDSCSDMCVCVCECACVDVSVCVCACVDVSACMYIHVAIHLHVEVNHKINATHVSYYRV